MKIDKAIEILKAIQNAGEYKGATDNFDAIRLGIEALKAVKQDRDLRLPGRLDPLPGETKE